MYPAVTSEGPGPIPEKAPNGSHCVGGTLAECRTRPEIGKDVKGKFKAGEAYDRIADSDANESSKRSCGSIGFASNVLCFYVI
jgi:hypothetical protein